eukprot:TRINITY_DN13812_c0_g5_i1.p1 TRINITY_DN13812_c0_g5~~TRINITY_DN13812_c0_g5_i1.p1  ORF type:complete len:660 (-),score=146.11 TRINITY_DN13812_c0_g5_i1:943-2922(-)
MAAVIAPGDLMPGLEAMPGDNISSALTPRSAAQSLVSYQENHQIELFMQEMLSVVFAILPEDPFEYMTYHIASHRPSAPPAASDQVCTSSALWSLLPGGDPLCAEHWRLRRCWLTTGGLLCISNASSNVTKSAAGLHISPPSDLKPRMLQLDSSYSHEVLDEDEAARPFAFRLVAGANAHASAGGILYFAAGSDDQRDDWLGHFEHFQDPARSPAPAKEAPMFTSTSKLPLGTFASADSVKEHALAPLPSKAPRWTEQPRDQLAAFSQSKPLLAAVDLPPGAGMGRERNVSTPQKGILKAKPPRLSPTASSTANASMRPNVPAIRLGAAPRFALEADNSTLPQDPSERRPSIRFSDHVDRREFAAALNTRLEPVPQSLRAGGKRKQSEELPPSRPLEQPVTAPLPPAQPPTALPAPAPVPKSFEPPPRSPRPTAGQAAITATSGFGAAASPAAVGATSSSPSAPANAVVAEAEPNREEMMGAAARALAETLRTPRSGSPRTYEVREEAVKQILTQLVDALEQDAQHRPDSAAVDTPAVAASPSAATAPAEASRPAVPKLPLGSCEPRALAPAKPSHEQVQELVDRVLTGRGAAGLPLVDREAAVALVSQVVETAFEGRLDVAQLSPMARARPGQEEKAAIAAKVFETWASDPSRQPLTE